MTRHDWNNLQFLLGADKGLLREWYDSVGPDDHKYAYEIMGMYRKELELSAVLNDDTEVREVYEANLALGRFRL